MLEECVSDVKLKFWNIKL